MIFLSIFQSFATVVLVHAGLRHIRPSGNSVFQFLVAALLGVTTLAAILWVRQATPWEIVTAMAMLGFICELYLFMFTFVIGSVSIALLFEKAGRSPRSGARNCDPALAMPEARIERMIESGLLLRSAQGLVITRRGKMVLLIRNGLRSFFHHDH